jgi:mRNA interferase RelE/StbE
VRLAWTIEFEQDAIRQLNRLDKSVRRRIVQFLETRIISSGDPRRLGKPLKGMMAEFWGYRVGDYRLVCLLEDDRMVVAVVSVAHRREVYR